MQSPYSYPYLTKLLAQRQQAQQQAAAQSAANKQSIASTAGQVGGALAGKYAASQLGGLLGKGAISVSAAPALPGSIGSAGGSIALKGSVPAAKGTGLLSGAAGVGALPAAAIAGSVLLGGKAGLDMLKGDTPNLPGRAILGVATGGLSEIAGALLGRKTTRDIARENTSALLEQYQDDANYQDYVSGMRDQYDSAPVDSTKPFAGKYGSWDEYKNAGLEAGDLTGVLGNLELGPEYTNLDFEQQKDITQQIIDAGLYDSKKGEVIITDEDRARQILTEALQR